MLPGITQMPVKQVAAGAITITYVASPAVQTANLSIYTFSGAAIGTASAGRYVVVACAAGGDFTISGCTIAGNAATLVANSTANNDANTAMFILLVTTGTTADIVVDIAGADANANMAIHVYTITGTSGTAHDTLQFVGTTGTPTGTIDVPAGGGGIGVVATRGNGTPRTYTWAGLADKNADATTEANDTSSAASEDGLGVEAGRTITATPSGTITAGSMSVATWGP